MRVVLLLLAALALSLPLAGCGGDDEGLGVEPVPAAGEYAQTADEAAPGVPAGSSYDLTAGEWLELEDVDRFEIALDFVASNPAECTTGEGTAAADPVREFADSSAGADYPLNAGMAELLAEGCAAALQSGEQGLAEPSP